MFAFILRRALATIPVLFGVSVLVFSFIHLIPGDPAVAMLGERATEENVARMRQQLGLDDPLPTQYVRFLFGETEFVVVGEENSYTTRRGEQCVEVDGAAHTACRTAEGKWQGQQNEEMSCQRVANLMVCHDNGILWGDLGRSIQGNIPIVKELERRFPATIELALVAILIAIAIGIPAGVVSSLNRNSAIDTATMFAALAGVSMPVFWLGILLMWFFGLVLGWLPTGGRISPNVQLETITNFYILDSILTRNWAALRDVLRHIILPAVALATISLSIIARMTRSSMLDVLGQDYMRTAKAKGLANGVQVRRHAMRNAMVPIVTIIGLQFGGLLAGAILTETIFSWPGIGKWVFDAIGARDYAIVQSVTLIIAFTFVMVNLLVDISYAWLNPRIRYE